MRRISPLTNALGYAVVAGLTLPLVVLLGVSLNAGVEQNFPPSGLSLRWYANIANRDGFVSAIQTTLILAAVSTVLSTVISVLAALAIVRHRFFGRDALLTAILSPLIVPQVVVGMAFLVTLSALGIFSSMLGLLLLHAAITLPFSARVVVASLMGARVSLEEAARSLGAPPWKAFVLVTLPLIRPGIGAGAVFAFVTSFENFTATQFLVWDRTTLPVEIYTYVQTESDPTGAALSSTIVLSVCALVLVLNRLLGLDTLTRR
ncbi:MAG: ABC transporter permease [Burkholderiales bacterium]|nr:ABC transporter permease [Burkholderiales bacterium]